MRFTSTSFSARASLILVLFSWPSIWALACNSPDFVVPKPVADGSGGSAAGSLAAQGTTGDGGSTTGVGGIAGNGGVGVAGGGGDQVVLPGCTNNRQDELETDIDCGGDCPACSDGQNCVAGSDCFNFNCVDGVCTTPTCDDQMWNGVETDEDCGRQCGPCPDDARCDAHIDCQSRNCAGDVCQVPNCADNVKNGAETDLDCGGGECDPCEQGQTCSIDGDCTEPLVCDGGLCVPTSCRDDGLGDDETDVDCGGDLCPPCAADLACDDATDCVSLICVGSVCLAASCSDDVLNQKETDVDCGGDCPPCEAVTTDSGLGARCLLATDCASMVCNQGRCQEASCADSVQNGPETDVNCGGGCPRCGSGKQCRNDADCRSNSCVDGVCD